MLKLGLSKEWRNQKGEPVPRSICLAIVTCMTPCKPQEEGKVAMRPEELLHFLPKTGWPVLRLQQLKGDLRNKQPPQGK